MKLWLSGALDSVTQLSAEAFHRAERLNKRHFIALFLVILILRIVTCFQVPTTTSDVLRNLGYSLHAFDAGFGIYNTVGVDFAPESWTRLAWREYTFQYPPLTLVFFSFFSHFGLGIAWVKVALTAMDAFVAGAIYGRISKIAGLLVLSSPVSWWFTSHEGQFEALLVLFLALTFMAARRRWHFLAGILFVLSLQVKQFAVFMAPVLLFAMMSGSAQPVRVPGLIRFSAGMAAGLLPFSLYYINRPDLLAIPLATAAQFTVNRNPFSPVGAVLTASSYKYQLVFAWYTSMTLILALGLALMVVLGRKQPDHAICRFACGGALAYVSLLVLSKVSRLWYPIVIPALLLPMAGRRGVLALLLLICSLQGLPIAYAMISGNHMLIWGHVERTEVQDLMRSCLTSCRFR